MSAEEEKEIIAEIEYWEERCRLAEACLFLDPENPNWSQKNSEDWEKYNRFLETYVYESR